MTRVQLRSEAGIGLMDVLCTLLIVTFGTLTLMAAFVQFSNAAERAQTHVLATSLAQRDLEQLRTVPYARIAMASNPSSLAAEAPRKGPGATEGLDVDTVNGVVNPGPDSVSLRGIRARVYRYVTWRQQTCPAIVAKVASQLATLFGNASLATNGTIGDLCPNAAAATGNSKRLTIVVVWDRRGVKQPPVQLSTVIVDPASSVPALATDAGMAVQKVTASVVSPTSTPAPSLSAQQFQLYDTRCDQATRQAPTNHTARDTSANGAVCPSGGSRPDLMGLPAIPGSSSDPVRDYSTDITRPAAGGLVLMRDDRAGNCTDPGNVKYANSEASIRSRSIHTWATPQATALAEIPATSARGGVTLWIGTATGQQAPGRLCVVLRRESDGAIVGSSDYSLPNWPGTADQMLISFDLTGVQLAVGDRLLLTLRVPSNSGSDLRLLYDHVSYPSSLSITTTVGKEFK